MLADPVLEGVATIRSFLPGKTRFKSLNGILKGYHVQVFTPEHHGRVLILVLLGRRKWHASLAIMRGNHGESDVDIFKSSGARLATGATNL